MGKEAGDEVVVTIPSGSRRFEIRHLVTLHDQAK
jgi:transcription elongation GreA/GreB family factor